VQSVVHLRVELLLNAFAIKDARR
ncbi:uncharacterized protein METZ01_LOCUS107997, partial [marine metagenome]